MSPLRILYLEDDENDVSLLREALAAEAILAEILHVITPWDFSEALKRAAPDLVLIDAKVAGFGGVAAVHMARACCPDIPRFVLTGLVTEEKAAAMHAAGAHGCLSKHDLSSVIAVIRRALENTPPALANGS